MLNDRFWSKVDKNGPNGCWLWKAGTNGVGYGLFRPGGLEEKKLSHRLAYEDKYGRIPVGKIACHKCDKPGCVNPDHIFIGSHKDNALDKIAKGRANHRALRGEDKPNALLTEDIVSLIRSQYLEGYTVREIAEHLNINPFTVRDAASGRSWKHTLTDNALQGLKKVAEHNTRKSAILRQADVECIKAHIRSGHSGKEIADLYGVSPATISDIKRGRTWRSVS